MKKNKYDIIIMGATGFTGQLVAEYITKEYGIYNSTFSWAIAGRDLKKLKKLKSKLLKYDTNSIDISIFVADCFDLDSLNKITSISSLIISTVGPYLKYGKLLIESCVKNGTSYCDLTGEVPFIRESIDLFDKQAKENKSRIIHSCGFDSIPSDIGVLKLQKQSVKNFGIPCDNVRLYVRGTKGGFSGGTIDSMINISNYIKVHPKISGLLGNQYALNPTNDLKGPDQVSLRSVKWDKRRNFWIAPFIMSGINTRVVRRSNAIMEFIYGKNFLYSEVYSFPKGFFGFIKALSMLISLGLLKIAIGISPILWVLRKLILPSPGQGPSKNARENGYFKLLLVGSILNEEKISMKITGNKDPGYAGTAVMLSEAALSIILESDKIPKIYGVLTPSSAIGEIIISRLKNKGITFELDK